MAAATVSIVLRVRRKDGTRAHYSAVIGPNGRLKAQYGIVDGQPTHLPGSVYYLRYRQGGQRISQRVGTNPAQAMTAKLQREHLLKGAQLGFAAPIVSADPTPARKPARPAKERVALLEAKKKYIRDIDAQRGYGTARGYENSLDTFIEGCTKTYLDELTREDVMDFITRLSREKKAPKTISNRCVALKTFLRKFGFDGKIVVRTDQPRVHKKLPRVYTREEVKALFAISNAEDRLVWEVFLAAGLREQELSHLGWEDVLFETGMLHLHAKPDLRFTLKDCEERQIPMPSELMAKLKARRERYPKTRLVFPTAAGKVEGHFLRRLKEIIYENGLNCGRCVNRVGVPCKDAAVCGQWQLHSFRRTAATRWHEAGLSVVSVQKLLGHADIETTMSYLAAQDFASKEFRGCIDGAFMDLAA